MLPTKHLDKATGYDQYQYLMFILPHVVDAHVIVETGLGSAESTRIFLDALSTMPHPEQRTLHTIDLLTGAYNYDPAIKSVHDLSFAAKWELHRGDARKGGELIPLGTIIDILYLDSDHAYQTVIDELVSFTPFIGPYTMIFTHDSFPSIQHSSYTHGDGEPSTTYEALRDWGTAHGYYPVLLKRPEGMTFLFKED
jgi:Methyltransferase domain